MLSYHPALDPYHTALRMLRILGAGEGRAYERDMLFLLDFFVAFPQLIGKIRLPPQERGRKAAFRRFENQYVFSGDPKLVFIQMRPLQETALRLLFSTDLLDPELFHEGKIQLRWEALPPALVGAVSNRNTEDGEVIDYVTGVLGSFPLYGPNGLKARTGLMEYRYDVV